LREGDAVQHLLEDCAENLPQVALLGIVGKIFRPVQLLLTSRGHMEFHLRLLLAWNHPEVVQ
jgi:hypothetical protein